jgi:hypothetical protein
MGRFLMYALLAVLAIFVLATYTLLEHGGGSIAAPSPNGNVRGDRDVSIHDLTLDPSEYLGEEVITEGVLSYSDEHERYQIIDEGNYAVIVRSYGNTAKLESLEGVKVRVQGTFGHDNRYGVYIDAESLEAAD